jgi:cell wall-associated NlpC family hydrolase
MTTSELINGAPQGALSVSGAHIVTAARAHLGVTWMHQGRSREGVDCLGLVLLVAHQFALTDFDTRDYARQAKDESMLEQCREHLFEIPRAAAQPGDVAVMRFANNRHIGIFGDYVHGGLSLIHAFSQAPRKVVEHRFSDDWLRGYGASLMGCFRFPGISA